MEACGSGVHAASRLTPIFATGTSLCWPLFAGPTLLSGLEKEACEAQVPVSTDHGRLSRAAERSIARRSSRNRSFSAWKS